MTNVAIKRAEQTVAITPWVEQGMLWLPVRALIEKLGGQVAWNETKQAISLTLGGRALEVVVGQVQAWLDGETVTLTAPPWERDGSAMMTWFDLISLLPMQLQWTFEPLAVPQPLSGVGICIDPGHGGSDPGAQGPNHLLEKDVNLSVGLQLRDLLQQAGARVVMTRASDATVSLSARAILANTAQVDWFVSIHCNSAAASQAHGTETYHYSSDAKGGQLAAAVQEQLITALGLTNRGVKTESFYVIKATTAPAILTELAFISNPEEEKKLAAAATRRSAAQAIYRGILATVAG